MFSEAELASLRSLSESAMVDLATTYRLKPIGEGEGKRPKGRTKYPDDYAANLTEEPCRFSATKRSRTEGQAAGQSQVRARGDWQIKFRAGSDVDVEDIVVITTRSNRKFNLTGRTGGTYADDIEMGWEANEVN
jgi:hypothetical protein